MKFFNQNATTPDPIPLTQDEFNKKKAELKKLLITQDEVIKRLQVAREMGDLSENGAYHAAKHELGNTRRQLRSVNHLLKYAYIPKIISSPQIGFGSKVTLSSDRNNLEFTLVSQYESNPLEKKLSMESPIGKAILGKTINDQAVVSTPSGNVTYLITAVS
jgi:transcription elongation factor GreA